MTYLPNKSDENDTDSENDDSMSPFPTTDHDNDDDEPPAAGAVMIEILDDSSGLEISMAPTAEPKNEAKPKIPVKA